MSHPFPVASVTKETRRHRVLPAAGAALAVTFAFAPGSRAQVAAATPIVDNTRVLAYETTVRGAEAPKRIGSAARDVITVSLGHDTSAGAVRFEPRGSTMAATTATGPFGPDVVVIELKDTQVAPLANPTAYPLAFPRPGVKKVLENVRVLVWDYSWTPGVPTPMHFHDKDVVVVYLADGALRSTTPDGASVVNPHYFGFTKFNSRDRAHTEELVSGSARAIIVELK